MHSHKCVTKPMDDNPPMGQRALRCGVARVSFGVSALRLMSTVTLQ